MGGEGIAVVSKPTFQSSAKVMLYSVGAFTAKEAFLRSQIHIKEPGPGYVHLADWLSLEHLEQLTSEKLVTRLVKGKRHREWIKIRDRNEALDCRNYAFAALHSLPLKWLQKHGLVGGAPRKPAPAPLPAAEEKSPEATPTTPETLDVPPTNEPPPKKKRRRPRWATDY